MTFDLQPFAEEYSEAFLNAARFTLIAEGGGKISDHPADKGGRTRWGIAEKYHPGVWRDGPPSLATALDLYHRKYWLPIKGDSLPLGIDHAVFDSAVLFGTRRPAQWLQTAINKSLSGQVLAVDGVIGPKTAAAISDLRQLYTGRAGNGVVADSILWRRICAHAKRVTTSPDQVLFMNGWARRCAALSEHITNLQ